MHYLSVFFCSVIDSRTKNRGKLQRDLEANDWVDGRSDIPLITNENKYPDGLQFLPIHISLSNGEIMKLKSKTNILSFTGKLDHFGLRTLAEPFQSEQELSEDENLTEIEVLKERINKIIPLSDFKDIYC